MYDSHENGNASTRDQLNLLPPPPPPPPPSNFDFSQRLFTVCLIPVKINIGKVRGGGQVSSNNLVVIVNMDLILQMHTLRVVFSVVP